jgi:hypothetical protein
VEREVIERVKAEHYAKWPDESLPALGGKTARQAVQTPEGRKAVEDLLRMMENREAREGREGQPVYDFTIVRRELGLTKDRRPLFVVCPRCASSTLGWRWTKPVTIAGWVSYLRVCSPRKWR